MVLAITEKWAHLMVSNSVAETVVYLAELMVNQTVGSKVSVRDTYRVVW